jgi:glycosyltransferase involved in cell wall biosynthesis
VTSDPAKPRVLFVGRTRYRLPLSASLARKFEALGDELELHVLASALPGSPTRDETFTLARPLPGLVDGIAFWLALPSRIARLLRTFRPDAIVCQTAHDAAAALLARRLAGAPARIVVEVHGDWRTSTRLYGSSARRLLSHLGDAVAAAALRRADAVRTVSPFTAQLVRGLGLESTADFPAYMDLEPFLAEPRPLPSAPSALFVGVLEAYKNVDGLAAAWRLAAQELPGASLRLVGKGSKAAVAESLVRMGVRWDVELSSAEVAQAMDDAWVLVLPSRSEGMGRVLVEAFCRGRAVVGTRAGSIPDLVEDGVSGVLVPPDDPQALADALVRVLGDRAVAERLGEGASAAAALWLQTPQEYARKMRELVA